VRLNGRFTKKLGAWAKRPADELDAAALALVSDSQAAARLRSHQNNPAVSALTIERTRDRLDIWGWVLIFAGLTYTTVNVQQFVAGNAPVWDLLWIVAWGVEPMVMGLMLVLLRGEQIANRYGEQSGLWVRWTRWISLLITYVMNTYRAILAGVFADILIHSVPVVMVFLASEALVQQRLTLTTVVSRLEREGEPTDQPTQPRRWADLSPAPGPEVADSAPQIVKEPQTRVVPTPTPADEVSSARTLKERAWSAFCELAIEAEEAGRSLGEIGPAEVDRRANVKRGTAKVSGRMAEFRTRWEREQGGEGDGAALG
jgi:hypothetical protein